MATTETYEQRYQREQAETAQRRADFEALLPLVADRVQFKDASGNRHVDDLVFIHKGREFHAWTRFDEFARKQGRMEIRLDFSHLPGYTSADERGYFKDIYQDYKTADNDAKPRNSISVSTDRPADKLRADILRRLGPVAAAAEDEIKARIAQRLQDEDAEGKFIAAVSGAIGHELTMHTSSGGHVTVLGSYGSAIKVTAVAGRLDMEIKIMLDAREVDQWRKSALTTEQAAEIAGAIMETMRAYAAKYND